MGRLPHSPGLAPVGTARDPHAHARTRARRTRRGGVGRRITLLSLVATGAGCAGGPGGAGGDLGAVGLRSTAAPASFDYDWSVRRIGGGELELEALRGRTLVVNFWASWCPPCIRELASFEALAESVRARGVEATFLFVSPEPLDVASEFVEDHGWELPFAVELRRAPPELGDLVLPTTFVVDRNGAIALRHRGATDWNQPEVVELLASLDAEGTPRPGIGSTGGGSR